jgi:hypothetical protein
VVEVSIFPPLPVPITMPAPLDPDSADGVKAFTDSINAGNQNFSGVTGWSAPFSTEAYGGTQYGASAISMDSAVWTLSSFRAIVLNKMVIWDLIAQNVTALSSNTACQISPARTLLTFPSGSPLVPMLMPVYLGEAVINDTAVAVKIDQSRSPSASTVSLMALAVPSRTIAAGGWLYVHAAYLNQVIENTVTP